MKQTGFFCVVFFLILNHAIENCESASSVKSVSPTTTVFAAPKNMSSSSMLTIPSTSTVNNSKTQVTTHATKKVIVMSTSSLSVQSVVPTRVVSVSSINKTVEPVSSMVPPFSSAVRNTTFSSVTSSSAIPPASSSTTAPTSKPTPTPKPQPGPKDTKKRRFDTASFFGGIILASGLFVCGYFIWRFYKNRRSYHHL